MLSAALFVLWLLLNQSLSPGNLLLALVVAWLVPLLTRGLRPLPVRIRPPGTVLRLGLTVVADTVASNLAVARLLDLWAFFVGRQREHEDTSVVLFGHVQEGLDRSKAQERAHGDGVSSHGRILVKVGVGVSGGGAVDVTALDVQDRECSGVAEVLKERLEDHDASGTEPLEECRLRLDEPDLPCECLSADRRKSLESVDRIGEPPLLQQGRVRVDASAQRSVGVSRRLHPRPKTHVNPVPL